MRNNTNHQYNPVLAELEHSEAVQSVARFLLKADRSAADVATKLNEKFHQWIDMRYADNRDFCWREHQVRRFESVLNEAVAIHEQSLKTNGGKAHLTTNEKLRRVSRKGGVFFKLGSNEPADAGKTVEVVITAEPVSSDGRAEFAVGYATTGEGESGLCRYRLEEGRNVYSFRCATGKRAHVADPVADYLGIWPDTNGRGNSVLISDVVVREVSA